jgi:hypothetical protein
MLVLKDDVQVHRLRFEGQALRCGAQGDGKLVACFELGGAFAYQCAVDCYGTVVGQLLQIAARKLGGQLDQRPVQALAVQGDSDFKAAQLVSSSASDSADACAGGWIDIMEFTSGSSKA